jgi:hypothetical protein
MLKPKNLILGGAALAPVAPNTFFYFSTRSRTNYSLSTFHRNQTTQQSYCNSIGGHLASYDNQTEQNEVEQAFIKQVSLVRTASVSCPET